MEENAGSIWNRNPWRFQWRWSKVRLLGRVWGGVGNFPFGFDLERGV